MTRVGLVACAKQKRQDVTVIEAQDLYTSQLFRAARAYCEGAYDRWYILSALHGLLWPHQPVRPYEATLVGMRAPARYEWNRRVVAQLHALSDRGYLPHSAELYVHAGINYRDWTGPSWFAEVPWPVIVPLEGLPIGRQLAWYAAQRPTKEDSCRAIR